MKTSLSVIVLSVVAASLGDVSVAQSGLIIPRVESRPQPPTPTNAAGVPVEGWAIVRYTVLQDGTTSDVRIVDVVPPAVEIAPTLEAVSQWTFLPGTQDGEPIDWYNTESIVAFTADEEFTEASDRFVERYGSIGSLLEAEAFEEALVESQQLLDECASRIELGLALAQQAIIHFGLGDSHSALESLRLATDPRIPSLPSEELLSGLQLRFQMEAQLGRRKEALDTNQRIEYALGNELINPFEGIAGQLRLEWETVEALPVAARVDDEPWRIAAARRTFTLDDIDGQVRGLDIECDRRAVHLDFQEDAEWSLPASWGNCEVFIDADPGTTFFYYEFLDSQSPG